MTEQMHQNKDYNEENELDKRQDETKETTTATEAESKNSVAGRKKISHLIPDATNRK